MLFYVLSAVTTALVSQLSSAVNARGISLIFDTHDCGQRCEEKRNHKTYLNDTFNFSKEPKLSVRVSLLKYLEHQSRLRSQPRDGPPMPPHSD